MATRKTMVKVIEGAGRVVFQAGIRERTKSLVSTDMS